MTDLILSDFGSYTVGGRPLTVQGQPETTVTLSPGLSGLRYDPNGHFWIEQAYVQYFVPRDRHASLPVLLVHGGGLTGSSWETTPDGRPGWVTNLLQAGLAVHVVDNVERGRAGFCAMPGEWAGGPIVRSEEESWSLYRFGDAAAYPQRCPYPGQRFPVRHLDELTQRTVPRWPGTARAQYAALVAVAERIGPCVVIGHSQGGGFAVELAADRPDLVRAVVALEPHGGFARVGDCTLDGRALLTVSGDFFDRSPLWRELDLKATEMVERWKAAGGQARVVRLGEVGLHGHSHMMMMDEGSEDVAALVARWIMDQLAV